MYDRFCRILVAGFLSGLAGCDNYAGTGPQSSDPDALAGQHGEPAWISTTQPSDRLAEQLDIFEAVFRYQFDNNASGAQRNTDFFFLALDESTDPPADLMRRFADARSAILPRSMAVTSLEEGVRHKDRDSDGIIFHIDRVNWIDEDTVDVEGGYYEGNMSASLNTYHVKRRDGAWTVTGDTLQLIS